MPFLVTRYFPLVTLPSVPDLLQRHLVPDLLRGREDLPATLQPAADINDRLVGNLARLTDPAHPQQEDAERVHTAFVHQRTGHDLVVTEVAGQEPVLGMDVEFTQNRPHAELASDRIELQHTVDQPHAGMVER